jgi:bifunctional DNA-binding transcriptional regulator/antitoxin component of YhaV-PrlF toxin-antitoxin module
VHSGKILRSCSYIPKKIREVLKIKMGDDAIFKIVDGNKVLLQKVSQIDKRYLKSLDTMLSEWSSKEDDEAFDDLQNV